MAESYEHQSMKEATSAKIKMINNIPVTEDFSPAPVAKVRKLSNHTKMYLTKWESDPSYESWIRRSVKGDTFYYCLACNQDYTCGKSELDKHASSRKHTMNLLAMTKSENDPYDRSYEVHTIASCDDLENASSFVTVSEQDFDSPSNSNHVSHIHRDESNEEAFGRFIISELKRIRNRRTYELVKGEILMALQSAILKEINEER